MINDWFEFCPHNRWNLHEGSDELLVAVGAVVVVVDVVEVVICARVNSTLATQQSATINLATVI
jgi:hypothetical protein